MIDIFLKGGIMMYPLLICSFIAVAVAIERLLMTRKDVILSPEIMAVVGQVKKEADFSLAKSVCEKSDGPFANLMISCIDNRDLPIEELRATIEDEGRQQVRSINRGLGVLETVAGIAPLLGLLGTVLGMINVFDVIESLGVGQAKALSGGISEALITTAAGLIIGIPSLIAYNYFSSRSENLILDIEKHTLLLLNKIVRMRTGENSSIELSLQPK